ncbi:Elongator complex protein 1 [Thelohanellus kitauei]|uniref:Elongator complex protein 1 n=1 Tax=Thelohanellus kitauei TaxID=669202 RepID=A0A0C2NA01_THEKT|nr:Elongator complex protein 1 [Thelohanellus kitauei]
MNNLHLIHERLVHIQLFESSAEPCCSQLENDFLFIGHHHDVYLYNCQNHDFSFQDSKRIQDLDAADDIIALEYIKETQTLIIVITNGFIVSCHDFPIGKFILKSQIEGGCHQARWSPNLSLIAIVKDEGRIFIIDSYGLQNEPLATIDIHKDQKSEYESKSVGWGKRDTQFRGQGMRLDPSNSQASQGSQIADYCDSDINQIKVSWRYDSKYFAVSYFSETYGRRLGVWSPDGVLYAMVKDQPGLYSVLSWAPTGYWITTAFKNEASYEIINYERNCLKRCSFKLDFVDPNDKVIFNLIDY